MAYNPQLHSLSAKPYGPSQGVPTDARSYFYDEALFVYRPYKDVPEVLTYLNTDEYRTGQFPIFVSSGSLQADGTFTGGTITEYWFKDGVGDSDLVVKSFPSTPLPADVDAEVQGSGSTTDRVVAGQATFTYSAFIGQRVRLLRNYTLQGTRSTAPTYYTFDTASGTFTVSPLPELSETFQIQAY
jgi:hypothetical protein